MNRKDKLYYDLIEAYRNHSCNDTLIDTYIYKVLKLVKDYLDFDNLKKENQELIVNKNVAQAVAFDQKREIGELKDKIAYLKEELEGWQSAYEWSQSKNSILKLENQELKEQLKLSNESQETVINTMNLVSQENEKLKKAIEKFIEYLHKEPNKTIPKHSIKQTLNKLLKEALENE